jgi:hypothetical protein
MLGLGGHRGDGGSLALGSRWRGRGERKVDFHGVGVFNEERLFGFADGVLKLTGRVQRLACRVLGRADRFFRKGNTVALADLQEQLKSVPKPLKEYGRIRYQGIL